MSRTTQKLSALKVSRLNTPGFHHDGGGLYLQISPSGAKSWIYRFMLAGRQRDMGLGPLPVVGLADARAKATEARRLKSEGIDPIEARAAVRQRLKLEAARAVTFKDAGTGYIEAHAPSWKSTIHAAQWPNTLETYAYPILGNVAVQDVDVTLVLKVLEPIWAIKTETANRVRQRIEAILDWSKARGQREGENPARWRGHLEELLPLRNKVARVKHFPALPFLEIGNFVTALRQREGVASQALEFLILTACRTGEALGARWTEIDFANAIWTVPADRIKAGKEHRIPLSEPALDLLKALSAHADSDIVFPGPAKGKPLSNNALLSLLKRMNRDDITVHGFRSTFRDWAAEKTTHSRDVVEMALAHAIENKVEAAYRRGDLFLKRTLLMDDWARYCGTVIAPGQVVQFDKKTPVVSAVAV